MEDEEIIEKLSRTLPKLKDEPRAYVKALIRMGYEAGKESSIRRATLETLEEDTTLPEDFWENAILQTK